MTGLRLLTVLENIFELDDRSGHEIVFVFAGTLTDATIYERDTIDAPGDAGARLHVVWRRLDTFDEQHRLVPAGLLPLLRAQ